MDESYKLFQLDKLIINLTQVNKIKFPLNKAQEEINFMYNNTIAKASRNDLQFYILVFFLILHLNGKNSLYSILEDHMDRLLQLSNGLNALGRRLKKDEYSAKKSELKLDSALKFDVIFLLLDAVANKDLIIAQFSDFFEKNSNIKTSFEEIADEFGGRIADFNSKFPTSRIEDDRYDDDGNYFDLSKSVYKTVGMRLSKKIDISLQQFTHINAIKSQSPIDLNFTQFISPELLFMLWGKFHLAEYIWSLFPNFKDLVDVAIFVKDHTTFQINLFELILLLITTVKSFKDDKKVKEARKELLQLKQKQLEDTQEIKDLLRQLTSSIILSPKKLEERVSILKKHLEYYEGKNTLTAEEKRKRSELKLEIKKLENIRVFIQESD